MGGFDRHTTSSSIAMVVAKGAGKPLLIFGPSR